jgi:hypothetical protein
MTNSQNLRVESELEKDVTKGSDIQQREKQKKEGDQCASLVVVNSINVLQFTEFVQTDFEEHASATAKVLEGNHDSIHTAINATVSNEVKLQEIDDEITMLQPREPGKGRINTLLLILCPF